MRIGRWKERVSRPHSTRKKMYCRMMGWAARKEELNWWFWGRSEERSEVLAGEVAFAVVDKDGDWGVRDREVVVDEVEVAFSIRAHVR